MSRLTAGEFKNFFTYYKGESQQQNAVKQLWEKMPVSLLEDTADWVVTYRTAPEKPVSDSVLPPQGVSLICEFEGFRANVYNDGMNVATIGYGSTFYLDGRKVAWGDPSIGEPEAREMMEAIAEKDFWNVISCTIPFWDQMNANQQSALLSYSYNLGARFYGANGFSTISSCLKDKRWKDVPAALLLYVNPGSSVEAGLKRRRKAEGDLWSTSTL